MEGAAARSQGFKKREMIVGVVILNKTGKEEGRKRQLTLGRK